VVLSPLLPALLAATAASPRTEAVRSLVPTATAAPHASAVGRGTAVAGGLAALVALAAVGVAAAARSSGWLAAGVELARVKPSFGLGHCPRWVPQLASSRAGAAGVASGVSPPPSGGEVHAASHGGGGGSTGGGTPPSELPTVPHVGGILGSDVTKCRPWEILKLVLLATLGAANAVLLAIRWRVARLTAR
jgi:hypothetical protein